MKSVLTKPLMKSILQVLFYLILLSGGYFALQMFGILSALTLKVGAQSTTIPPIQFKPQVELYGTIAPLSDGSSPVIDGDTFWVTANRAVVGGKARKCATLELSKDSATLTRRICPGDRVKIRLRLIDAPEFNRRYKKKPNQPFGSEARNALALALPIGTQVRLTSVEIDPIYPARVIAFAIRKYGRTNKAESDIGFKLIQNGWAWFAADYYGSVYFDPSRWYRAAWQEAIETRRGLHAVSGGIAPWDWRKQH